MPKLVPLGLVVICWGALSGDATRSASGREPTDLANQLKTIRILPQTEAEVASAHERAKAFACEQLPAGESLEITSFIPERLPEFSIDARSLPVPCSRRAALSVGIDILPDDRVGLPRLSGGRILDYLYEHYVCLELRLLRDLDSGEAYFHHRLLAATTTFTGARLTVDPYELISRTIQDIRSLGLLLDRGKAKGPEDLRTLALVFKNMRIPDDAGPRDKPQAVYELGFIRGRSKSDGGLTLHTFATTENRKLLHYLEPFTHPRRPQQCSLFAGIRITDYKFAELLPADAVTRRSSVQARRSFVRRDLETFVEAQGWKGSVWDNTTGILDAIIDGKLTSSVDRLGESVR